MELQAGLNGLGKAERARRGTALLERVGLIDAADRKVGGYSGGMKRRLDLAIALVHRPDDPLPRRADDGPGPQSRSALWDEVERLAAEDGVTGLPDHAVPRGGRRARRPRRASSTTGASSPRGTPDELKREIGGDTVEADPGRPARPASARRRSLARFGEPAAHSPKGAAVRLRDGAEQLPEHRPRARRRGVALAHLQLHSPSLDDVFLAKTGRSLEGAGEETPRTPPRREPSPRDVRPPHQVGLVARRSVRRTLRQPALIVPTLVFPLFLLAVNSSG
jgi:ABC-2 type transport system ATP-binding protein